MYPLNENDLLLKRSYYTLNRDGENFTVIVSWRMAGMNAGNFMAELYYGEKPCDIDFQVFETSEAAALRLLFSSVQGWSAERILAHRSAA